MEEEATLLIPFIRSKLNEDGSVKDETTLNAIRKVTEFFVHVLLSVRENIFSEYYT